jgi:DNA polymerase-1
MGQKTALLIDGHSLANRAFYALPPLTTSQGVPTGAVYGFLTMLFRFLQEKRPNYVAVAFDHPSPTFRHNQYNEYKATRKPAPDSFKQQIPILKDALETLNLVSVEMPGYEADDVIGTLARRFANLGHKVIILSGDRDCLQLVDGNIQLVLPVKGISQVREYDPIKVREDMGIDPKQVVDFKALRGDPSDNIPGVRGIGDKTAAKLLSEFHSLENIYECLEDIEPKKTRNLLEKGKDSAFLSLKLATINTNSPLGIEISDLQWERPDFEAAKEKFTELEFHTLVTRLGQIEKESSMNLESTSDEPVCSSYTLVTTEDGLSAMVDEVRSSGILSVYGDVVEITRDFRWPKLIGVSDGIKSYAVRLSEMTSERRDKIMWEKLGPLLTDPNIKKTGFGIKWLFTLCFKRGITLRGDFFDVLVAAYLLDPTRSEYRLEDLSLKYQIGELPLKPTNTKSGRSKQQSLDQVEKIALEMDKHFALGAKAAFEIVPKITIDLETFGLKNLATSVEFPLIQVLAAMEATGVGVNLDLGESIREHYGNALELIQDECYKLAGEEFNLGSPKQLSSILFDKLGLKPVKKTKTGYSTDAGVLEILSLEHPLPERILEYRQYAKIKSTYLDVLEDVINPTTGRIHSTFHQTVTATGRLSSSEPNLQNIPVRGELGRSVRKIFIPAEGRLLLASDYSQIELRIMAHMANDPSMIDAFRRGEDIHSRTASEMFGVPIEEVDSDLRSKAKAVNFGVIYGISDFGLARNTGVTREEAKHFIATYFERYPKIKEFMDECIRAARESGFAITILGRRRPIPDINARIKTRRAFAERTAVNTPIQGSAADLIKLAMVRIYRRLKKEQLISRLILQVHDELIFEVPAEESDYMRQLVREEMEGVMNLRVPLKVDIDVGKNWYEV